MANDDSYIPDILWMYKYNQETGRIVYKVRSSYSRPGQPADNTITKGARQTRVNGKLFYSHRVAWVLMTGKWPTYDIDHIDGNPSNNAWANLRDIDTAGNIQNQLRAHKDSRTKLLGVTKLPDGRFKAQIKVLYKNKHLGLYATAEEAHQAYLCAKRKLHQGCTI
jgi:hypothetical protein